MIFAVFDPSPLTQWINCSFYRAMLCMRGASHGPVCLSVVSRCSTKMAKRMITQTTPHDSQWTLVFLCHRPLRNFTGATRMGTPNAGGRVKIGDFRQITGYISKTVKDRHIQQPFNGRLSGTTRVGRYQKKHSPAHTHPGQRTSFIIFLHMQRSTASSLFSLRS